MNILEIISEFIDYLITLSGIWGVVFSCLLITVESILPFMPLAVFITINFIAFGNVIGFFISWFFTILGCLMSYYIFKRGFNEKFNRLIKNKTKLENMMSVIENLSLGQLVVLIAIPFTPAFLVNIAAGLSNISFKKFFVALIIGKISLVYFWGFVGTSLIDSLTNPNVLIKVFILVLIMYLISRFIGKKIKF